MATTADELERLRFLELERERSMAFQKNVAPAQQISSSSDITQQTMIQAAKEALASSPANLTKKFMQTDPATMQRVGGRALPILGGLLAGPAAPVGAALGELARQATGTAFAPETVPQTPLGRFASVVSEGVSTIPAGTAVTEGGPKVGEVVGKAAGKFGKGWDQFIEALTGRKASGVARLRADPGVILPEALGGAKSVEQASADYGRALGHPGLTKPKFNPFEGNKQANDMGSVTWQKWRSGYGKIDPQEAYDATQAVKYAMPAAITERNSELVRDLMQFKDAMNKILETQAGPLRKVAKQYGRARLKEDFSKIFPRTQTGKISTVKSFLLPALADSARLKYLAFSSPKLMGTITAAGTMGLNVLGHNPVIRQALLGILKQILSNKEQ